MKIIQIKIPFYTAGRLFRWSGSPVGIGIKLKLLEGDDVLNVRVGDNEKIWQIEKEKAREFVEKYQSYFSAKGTKLGVIAWYMFNSGQENKQDKLF